MRDKIVIIGIAVAVVVIGVLIFAYTTKTASKAPSLATNVATGTPSVTTVPFTRLAQGTQSSVTKQVNYFITSPDEFKKLWKTAGMTGTPPAVDFNTQMVLAVFAGEKPTAGYAITVSKIEDAQARLVSIALTNPDRNCMVGQSLTAPYELVAVPATSLPLTHEDIIATTSCSN